MMSAEYRVHLQIRQSETGEYPATSDPPPGPCRSRENGCRDHGRSPRHGTETDRVV